jgi:hypothetical protein
MCACASVCLCVCVLTWETEAERDRERETERETERATFSRELLGDRTKAVDSGDASMAPASLNDHLFLCHF